MNAHTRRGGPRPLEWVTIGVVTAAHGVRGEVRVRPLTDFPDRFLSTERVFLRREEERTPHRVRGARPHGKGEFLLALEGVDDRNAAEGLRRAEVQVPVEEAVPLPPGTYYVFQLVGLDVDTVKGERLGTLRDVMQTGANDVYVVRDDAGKEVLIPALKEVVVEIDLDGRRIVVDPLPGLLE